MVLILQWWYHFVMGIPTFPKSLNGVKVNIRAFIVNQKQNWALLPLTFIESHDLVESIHFGEKEKWEKIWRMLILFLLLGQDLNLAWFQALESIITCRSENPSQIPRINYKVKHGGSSLFSILGECQLTKDSCKGIYVTKTYSQVKKL